MKGGDWHGLRQAEEIRQETKMDVQDIRRKVKGAITELTLALRTIDKLAGK